MRRFGRITTTLLAGAAAAVTALTGAPVSHAWGEYPVATPGAFLVSTALAGNGMPYQCTLGFVVRKPDGSPAALTAGHCRRDPNDNTVLQQTPNGVQHVGHYTRWEVVRGVRDAGLVDLAASTVPVVPQMDGMPVVRTMSAQALRNENPILCKSGARTGLSCGPITDVTATGVSFRAWDDLGDSGSPVYAVSPDGTVAAVGILYGHSDDAQGRIIHASLVEPVMHDWGLTLW